MKLGFTRRCNAIRWACLANLVACGPALRPASAPTEAQAAGSQLEEVLSEQELDEEPTANGQAIASPNSPGAPAAPVESLDDDGLDSDIATITESLSQDSTQLDSTQLDSTQLDSTQVEDEASARQDITREPIVYRVSPQGLTIEVDGLHLRPTVRAIRHKNGTFSLEISVKAESFDGRTYWLREPKEGPLSIAGTIKTAKGTRSRFADRRQGDQLRQLEESEPIVFRQRWPGANQPQLWNRQTLHLEVGLWGTRAEDERERPVRRLFSIEFLAEKGAQPAISPPALDWGT